MRSRRSLLVCARILLASLIVVVLVTSALASGLVETVLYQFTYLDGEGPYGDLVADAAGNLYGTIGNGGAYPGAIYELSPPATVGGTWTKSILHYFDNGPEGNSPFGGVILDSQGNLFGTDLGSNGNDGAVFELIRPTVAGGEWTVATLFTFAGDGTGGRVPAGKLSRDGDGNFYGTTVYGGTRDAGVVFELVAPHTTGGIWSERVLHHFGAAAGDGAIPGPNLLLRGGALYGVTTRGGAHKKGIVFRLTRKPGAWTETILHDFAGGDGAAPAGGLIADESGNLYGTTETGGANGWGTVYELSPPAIAGDSWQENVLYSFTLKADGGVPYAGLRRNKLGNLYGVTTSGGGGGSVFEIKPPVNPGGAWTFVFLHDFDVNNDSDGISPYSTPAFVNGVLYGTTSTKKTAVNYGTVFSVVP
jgi:uncharacterized repeat protein (TIGR03803 family)